MTSINAYIQRFSLDEHLNPDLLHCARLFRFVEKQAIYTQAEEQTLVYFLVAGSVQVNHYHSNGRLSVLAILKPLSVVGDLELFNDQALKTNVVALEETTLLGIERQFILRYGYDDPRFLRFIIQNLTQKLYRTSVMGIGSVLPLVYRFAYYLLQESDADATIKLPSKMELGGMLGTTSRHLNRVIKRLQEQGVIDVRGSSVKILNRHVLELYNDQSIEF